MKTRCINSLLALVLIVLSLNGYAQCCNANFSASPQSKLRWKFTPEDPATSAATSWKWEFGDGSKSSAVSPAHTYSKAGMYMVKLTKTTNYGDSSRSCSFSKKVMIYKNDSSQVCVAKFSTTQNGNAVTFLNETPTSGSTWRYARWTYGDGTTSLSWNGSHTYASAGTYVVTLTVIYGNKWYTRTCCKTMVVVVIPPCNAAFTSTINLNQLTAVPAFSASLSHWTFGDGSTASGDVVSHTYSAPGVYNVCRFIADSASGVQCQTCQFVVIDSMPVQDTCNADFTHILQGASLSAIAHDTAGYQSYWSFGDGAYEYGSYTNHTYTQNGVYAVCRYAYSFNQNDSCVTCKTIVVQGIQDSCFASYSHQLSGKTFYGIASGTHTSASYWTFGDGNYSYDQNPVHNYASNGTYNVCRIAITNGGWDTCTTCKTLVVQTPQDSCSANYTHQINGNVFYGYAGNYPSAYAYWSFGDGQYSSEVNPVHSYQNSGTYTVCRMATTSDYSDSCATCKTIVIQVPQDSCFASYVHQLSGKTFYGIASGTHTSASHWTFGDGNYSYDQNPMYTYANSGSYTVCRIAITADGMDTCTACKTIVVQAPPDSCFANYTHQLNGNVFYGYAGNYPSAYAYWSFGDGQYSSDVNPVHTYQNSGTYTVCRMATTTDYLDSCTTCKTIVVQVPQDSCTANYSHQTAAGTFYGFSAANTHTAYSYWTFGDGGYSSVANPVHSYTANGNYNVCHVVIANGSLDTCSSCKSIAIQLDSIQCEAEFTYQFVNDSLRLVANSMLNNQQHVWSFSNGSYASGPIASKPMYNQSGTVTVCHAVYPMNQDSCQTCKTINLAKPTVNPNPASDYILISSSTEPIKHYTLIDINGTTHLGNGALNSYQEQVNIQGVPSGTYTLRVGYGNNNLATYVLIIQH